MSICLNWQYEQIKLYRALNEYKLRKGAHFEVLSFRDIFLKKLPHDSISERNKYRFLFHTELYDQTFTIKKLFSRKYRRFIEEGGEDEI